MGGYQSALNGLRYGMFFFVVIDQRTSMTAKCNRSNDLIWIIYISQAGSYHQVYVIMLPVYTYYKDDTFLYKTGSFHAFMFHSLRVPIQIVKYVKNRHIIFASAINAERAAW